MERDYFIALLQQNYDTMSLFFSSEMTPAMKIPLAVQYSFSRETFNGLQFEAQLKKLQRKVVKQSLLEFFSTVSNKSVLSYKVSAHILLHEQTDQELKRLARNEAYLEAVGFEASSYQSIAAIFLMDEAHAKRTKSLHKEMKKQHHFLTGKDDIPYAVLLTREPANAQLQAQTMRCYYDELVAQDFKRGDALQAMSQLLTLYNADFEPIVIDYVRAICTYLKRENIKIRRKFYPFIAMLALAQANEETLKEVIMMNKKLTVLNMFSLEPALAFMTAVQFVLQRMIEKEELQQFSDSMLFLQALNMNDFLQDAKFTLAFNIFDFFI